ncbi:MAG: EutN/CcmL family microcompartment protein [Terriglobales bacterium]
MMLARVIGNVVCTVKDPGLEGRKLLLIQPLSRDRKPKGRALVGIDSIGAGFGETVYWCRGKEASLAFTGEVPSDCSIVGIVDSIDPPQGTPARTPVAASKPRSSARADSRRPK